MPKFVFNVSLFKLNKLSPNNVGVVSKDTILLAYMYWIPTVYYESSSYLLVHESLYQ